MNWEQDITGFMISKGWKKDKDDENTLGFTFYEDENREWIRDYDKKTRRFIQFNGRQKINLLFTKE